MATIPSRIEALELAVASIYDQVDGLFVYLNNYDDIPLFLKRDKISVFTSQQFGDIKDTGKFFGLTRVQRGIYLSLDDDIQYPPDYAQVMRNHVVRFKNKCVVGVHGIFLPTLAHSFFDRKAVHYEKKWDVTSPISILGTGTVAFSIEHSGISFDLFQRHGMADISLALFMKERRIPALVVRRSAGWLRSLLPDDDMSLYRSTQLHSIEHTAAIVAARPWGLSELCERVEMAGITDLLPDRWHAVVSAYRQEDDAQQALRKYPLATLFGLVRTFLNDCEAWQVAKLSDPTRPKDVQLHCNLLRTCLAYYPEQVLAFCLEKYSRYKEQQALPAMMAYASVYMAGLYKLSMHEEANSFYRDLSAHGEPSAEAVMEYLRLKAQEGDHPSVISLARDRYVELSQYMDFVPIAYGAVARVDGLQPALHGFLPSFFTDGRQASRRRRAIIATCKQAGLVGLGDTLAFDFASAEAASIRRGSAQRFLDLILLYAVLGEHRRARTLLDNNKPLVDKWYGSAMRALVYALTAENHEDRVAYINKYNKRRDLVQVTVSDTSESHTDFFSSLGSVRTIAIPEDKGKISILMGAFNSSKTVGYSVRSILNQSYSNLEVLVVDDASTDGTWEELEKLRRDDARVKLIRNEVNGGPYVCRNVAIEVADGDFIAIHDADDFAHPQRLERQMDAFDRKDVVAVFAAHIRFEPDGAIALENNGSIVGDGPMTFMCRRAVFSDIGDFEPVRTRGDIEFWDRMKWYYGSHRIVRLDDVLVYALHDADSNSHTMVKAPEAKRRLELFRADYNRRLMSMRSTQELEQSALKPLTPKGASPAVRVQALP